MTTENTLPNDDGFYVQDVDFRSGVVINQTPLVMATAAALGGFAPPDVNGAYTYCDLGCGDGTTVCALAAVNPEATFYGVDFNAGHIDKARATASELGLSNVAFVHSGFEDLAGHDLPVFDLIGMNGIYSWLESRPLEGAWDFLRKNLRPGGLFYVEYTALPGMAAVPPLWKLIQTLVPAQGLSSRERAEKGLAMLQMLAKRGMAFLAANPRAAQAARHYVAGTKNDPSMVDHFLHNAMASGFRPRYFQDMHREMSDCGLAYAGRTSLGLNVIDLAIPPGQIPTFRDIQDPVQREILTDFIRNEQCRRDVFVKDAGKDEQAATRFLLEDLRLLGRSEPENMQRTVPVMGNHQAGLRGPIFDALFQAFEDAPRPVVQVDLGDAPAERVQTSATKLIGSNQFFLCLDRPMSESPSGGRPALPLAMNRWLLHNNVQELRGTNLVSELTGGPALTLSPLEALLLAEALEHGWAGCVAPAFQRLAGEDKAVPSGRGPIQAKKIKQDDLEKLLDGLKGRKLTNMLRLGVVHHAS